MRCSNCEAEKPEALYVVRSGDNPATPASICVDCVKDVLTLKIVLHRDSPKAPFEFEGYLPVLTHK